MLAAYALAYCSFLILSMAMSKHFQQIFPKKKMTQPYVNTVRIVGWALLIATLFYCSHLYGWATGLVAALGLMSAAAFVLALILNYAPRFAPGMAVIAIIASLL
jgi:hypothetical protein